MVWVRVWVAVVAAAAAAVAEDVELGEPVHDIKFEAIVVSR